MELLRKQNRRGKKVRSSKHLFFHRRRLSSWQRSRSRSKSKAGGRKRKKKKTAVRILLLRPPPKHETPHLTQQLALGEELRDVLREHDVPGSA